VSILRSVVGKLWLTIIGLVAFVLIILGTFLIPYIDNYFSQSKDQLETLKKIAVSLSEKISLHEKDKEFTIAVNDLLGFENARLIVLSRVDMKETTYNSFNNSLPSFKSTDFFSTSELSSVFNGEIHNQRLKVSSKEQGGSNDEYVAVAVPLHDTSSNAVIGAAIIYQPLQNLEATKSYIINLFVYVCIVGFLMTTVFAFFLFYRITRPLQWLKKAADLITLGEYDTRVQIVSTDEIGELSKTFNHMGEKLQETIKALSHETEHLTSVLRSMTDAVITLDANGQVILANPEGQKIIKEWNNLHWSNDPDILTVEGAAESHTARIPEPLESLFEHVKSQAKDGTSNIHVLNSVWSAVMTPLYSWDGVRGAVAVLRDVTEEHRLDILRKDFVANVSHELRTPLSMLQGYSEALLDDIAGTYEERRELAQVIQDESLRMGRLVGDLLDLARMEAGHLEMNFGQVEAGSLIRRMHRKFSALAKERGIQLQYKLPEENSLLLGKADEDRLEQVLTNLLDNAIRHTASGANIMISGEMSVYKNHSAVKIDIQDQGKGIPAADLPYIFERFYKADKARTRGSNGGTGLGLAIVKNIVDAHQGGVTVQSSEGHGTTFTIYLPCNRINNM
jgi:two-component system, OmpR family, sensor histidine kinase ResE